MTTVAVAGGTGVVGRHVVERLQVDGHDVAVLSRANGTDLTTGIGLSAALRGIQVLIDVANVTATTKRKSVNFFRRATENLMAAEREVGVAHHVCLSIVGIDDVDFGYYFGKRTQESAVKASGVPWTILRATQFHEFPGQLAARVRGPILPVPVMRSQPVAAREVADALVDLAVGAPQRATLTMSGPEVHMMPALVREVLHLEQSRRLVVPVRLPGRVGAGMAGDALIDASPDIRGSQTFSAWLDERRREHASRS